MQDATVQSIPQMSQAPAVAPSSYVVPAQSAPAPSYQTAPVPYQVGMSYPQAVPQAAPSYQSAPTQYAPQYQQADQSQSSSAGNPWESAFNKVVNLLSAPVPSPFQGQPSAPTPQYAPANYGQVSSPATQQSARSSSVFDGKRYFSASMLSTPNSCRLRTTMELLSISWVESS